MRPKRGRPGVESSENQATRPKRRKVKLENYGTTEENADKTLSSWSDQEVDTLLQVMSTHGHLNYDAILEKLPGKTLQSYQSFLRTASLESKKFRGRPPGVVYNLSEWLDVCESATGAQGNSNGPLEIALVLKLLSLDGVLENHPLPEIAGGVDYGACYRVLYQAVLGHPIQSVNEATLNALYEAFIDVNLHVERNGAIVEKIKNLMDEKFSLTPRNLVDGELGKMLTVNNVQKKPVKSYERKKPSSTVSSPALTDQKPVISFKVEPVASSSSSDAPMYTLKTDGEPAAIPLVLPDRMMVCPLPVSPLRFFLHKWNENWLDTELMDLQNPRFTDSKEYLYLLRRQFVEDVGSVLPCQRLRRMGQFHLVDKLTPNQTMEANHVIWAKLWEEEKKILESVSYNPLGFPANWLKNSVFQIDYYPLKNPNRKPMT